MRNTGINKATEIIRECLGDGVSVTSIRSLHGGMINQVEKWQLDGEPFEVVAKLTAEQEHTGFKEEFESLKWYQKNSKFPVPTPYALLSANNCFDGTCLLMEVASGVNYGQARLTQLGAEKFQSQLADILAELHGHKRDSYGSALESSGEARWVEIFGPMIQGNFQKASSSLNGDTIDIIEKLLADLETWLPEFNAPTLVHGDIWATNIMVDDSDPNTPSITAFLDMHAQFAEIEYELAYLLVFATADQTFFKEYSKQMPLRDSFQRRCLVYWLNTMLLHVHLFGQGYLPRCEQIARQIAALS